MQSIPASRISAALSGKILTTSVRRPISFVEALEWIGRSQLAPVGGRERVEGEDVGLGVFEHRRDLGHPAVEVSNGFQRVDRAPARSSRRLDIATEAGRLAAFALAGVGRWEHERLSARTRRGLDAARSRGAGRGRATVDDVPELRERIVRMREQA